MTDLNSLREKLKPIFWDVYDPDSDTEGNVQAALDKAMPVIALAAVSETTPSEPQWRCGKCDREEALGYDDFQIGEHHRTCPKRNMSAPSEPRHFVPYGSTNAACDETVPKGALNTEAGGRLYSDGRFTDRRAETTCRECQFRAGITAVELAPTASEGDREALRGALREPDYAGIEVAIDAILSRGFRLTHPTPVDREKLAERLRQFAESQRMDFNAPDVAAMLERAADALAASPAPACDKQKYSVEIGDSSAP